MSAAFTMLLYGLCKLIDEVDAYRIFTICAPLCTLWKSVGVNHLQIFSVHALYAVQ